MSSIRAWQKLSNRTEPFQYTVWTEFTPLAIKNQAVNLGQGFPGFKCPDFVKQALADATNADENQYARSQGFLPLVQEIARVYGRKHNREINPLTEVVVTVGATEGIMSSFLGMIDEGDEVVIIEPSFDCYIPAIIMNGGKPVGVPLIPPQPGETLWNIDFERLESAFNERTRVFMINTPHNPIGKVFSRQELERIAAILNKWPNVAIISDEVYEYVIFDDREHLSIADFSNLWERTVTLSSAGKIFSITGWKTGWAVGGPYVIKKIATSHLWNPYCSNTPCQGAVARCLRIADEPYNGFPNYYLWLRNEYSRKREILYNLLKNAKTLNLDPIMPEGGFFLCARVDPSVIDRSYLETATPDFAFSRWLTEQIKICTIPCSAFYLPEHKQDGENLVRFALCKDYSDYEAAAKILINDNSS
ncbi:unnamed protein product [Blepharisma stoltei]|uniref:Aminotransferase class I/classII large domain-containing protein n=1 Tax=Blepharisma stoltei TaxID=1481888 RepID=A0AAU9J231_9CILI|nr:unnamed protein product [Blepharisma stoltei]